MSGTLWITGVAGFSGRHLVEYVATQPRRPRIIGFDIGEAPQLPVDAYERLDVGDVDAVAAAATRTRPDWVIHLAGAPPAASSGELWRVHVGSTLALATGLVRASGARTRLLSIGSAAEYLPAGARAITERSAVGPSTEYGRSKLAQTILTLALPRTLGLDACVARAFNLIGPGLPARFVLGRLCSEFARVGPRGAITIQHLETSRDFVDIRDAVDAYWRLVRDGRPGHVYNVCTGRPVGLNQLIERLCTLTGKRPAITTTHPQDPASDPDIVFGSYARLKRATGWTPRVGLDASIRSMLAGAEQSTTAVSADRSHGGTAT